MANLQFKGFYTTQDIVSFVVAGAADTPGVTASNPIFDATVDWGSGGQQNIRYTASSGNGIVISDKKVNLIHTDNTNSSSPEIKYYSSTGNKTVSITGGWKNALNDTDSYLALPKQSVSRYGSNVFLNNKKGDLSMSTDQSDLVFKFGGDYIGLRSSDGIKLVKGEKYSIPSNDFNFRLESNSHLDAVYSDGELDTKTESGFLQYFYDIDGVTYSSEFEIVDSVDASIAPALSEWDGMLTQRYSVDESAYDIFTFHGNSINPMNKRKAFRINLGTDFGLHGVGDFANYGMQRVENMSGHTQSFSGAIDHMFAGCTNFKFSSVISNMNLNGITSMLGFMSGCSSYVEHFKLNNATASVLTDLTGCFEYSAYKAVNIKNWDVSQVTSVESFLEGTTYNRAGISENWNTSNVTSFKSMFKNNSHFKQYLGGIDVSSAQSMEGMFHNAKEYNGYSAQWNVSNVSSFANMFRGASSFNKPISKWKTGSATSMKGMFCNASSFNKTVWAQPGTERWDTSNVESFESMFEGSSFGESTKSWNIGKVKSFKNMFKNNTGFNYQLPTWAGQFGENLAENEKSIDFTGMFESSVFNQSVKGWNVSSAISVKNMFKDNTEFNSQLFPGWKLKGTKCENVTNFLCGTTALHTAINSPLTPDSIKNTLTTYGDTVKDSIGFALMFCTDDSSIPDELKSDTYKTYRSAWESGNSVEVVEETPEELPSESSHVFSTKEQLRAAVIDWYEECSASYTNATNLAGDSLEYGPIGDWDVSAITDFSDLFDMELYHTAKSRYIAFVDLSGWDVSNGTNFSGMFREFWGRGGIDISGWDLGKATDCGSMFVGIPFAQYIKGLSTLGSTFTSEIKNLSFMLADIRSAYGDYYDTESSSIVEFDLSSWNVGSVTNMYSMFDGSTSHINGNGLILTSRVTSFGDLSSWDVSNVTNMYDMFAFLPNLEQPGDLSGWCVSQITSEPLNFAKNATWETNTSLQPNWGASC